MLARAAQLAPGESFPRELLLATFGDASNDEEAAAPRADALHRLINLGLLESQAHHALRLHRLLAAFVREATKDTDAQAAVEAVMLEKARHGNDADSPAELLPLQTHLRAVTDGAQQREDMRAADLCYELNRHLTMLGEYDDAEKDGERALAITRKHEGAQAWQTARCKSGLGVVLNFLGRPDEALELCDDAVAVFEQVGGMDVDTTARELDELDAAFGSAASTDVARPLLRRAQQLYARATDSKQIHARVQQAYERVRINVEAAKALDSLGIALDKKGRYAAARSYYVRALALRKRVLGEKHQHTARTLLNWSVNLHFRGKFAAARRGYKKALPIFIAVWGARHPDVATVYQNLGETYADKGDYASAIPFYKKALMIRKNVLGMAHPYTRYTVRYLARARVQTDDLQRAKPLLERFLTVWKAKREGLQADSSLHVDIKEAEQLLEEIC